MKSMAILILGCLPLSVLTVWSFVELGSVDDRLGLPDPPETAKLQSNLIDEVAAQVKAEKPLTEALAEVDLLSGRTVPGLEELSDESRFEPLKETWPAWTGARQTVTEFLRAEQSLATVDSDPLEGAGPEQLDVAIRRAETVQRQYEALKQKSSASPPRGAGQFLALVDGRIGDLARRIERLEKRREAKGLQEQAASAFKEKQYDQCVTLCDKLLAEYSQVSSAATVESVRSFRQRAQFWSDVGRLIGLMRSAGSLERRQSVLKSFLNRYRDRRALGAQEQQLLATYDRELNKIQAQLEDERARRAAEDLIRELNRNLPPAFDDRLRGTTGIVQRYPTETVKMILRQNAEEWLEELLPEKRTRESPDLNEAETTKGEIIRGYFVEVSAPDGTLLGYKRYPSLQASRDREYDVGTYRKEEFAVAPGPSLSSRCVTQYNQARNALLQAPGRREAWTELAGLCESLEGELRAYRRKKGAGREDRELSFESEGRFARRLVAGPGWADMETLFEP